MYAHISSLIRGRTGVICVFVKIPCACCTLNAYTQFDTVSSFGRHLSYVASSLGDLQRFSEKSRDHSFRCFRKVLRKRPPPQLLRQNHLERLLRPLRRSQLPRWSFYYNKPNVMHFSAKLKRIEKIPWICDS